MSTALLEHPAIVGYVEHTINAAEVKRRRLALGWSQEQLAERAGMTSKSVSNAEHGKIGEAYAARLMAALDKGEEERRKADQPELETWTLELDGVRVVVTGERGKLQALDLNAFIRPRND